MNLFRTLRISKSLSVLLSSLAIYGFIPQSAYGDLTSCSNGVSINDYSMATDTIVDFAYGNEVMTVAVQSDGSPMYDRVTIDDQLVFEFWWRYNSQDEKVLDYSTFTYQGWTATRDGMQLTTHPPAEQVDGTPYQEELHPAAAAQIDLVRTAMNQLHSTSFLQAVADTHNEVATNGIAACVLHIVAWVISVFALAACATVVACIPVLLGHVAAGVGVACNCSPAEC